MLQGPMGPFFRHIANLLNYAGNSVWKINFNFADAFYYARTQNTYLFRGSETEWPSYLEDHIKSLSIDTLLLFGDCRTYHRSAIERARLMGIDVFVMEEGYLRPDFFTFERDGVNGYSTLPRNADFYHGIEAYPLPAPISVGNVYAWGVLHSIIYSVLATLFWWLCPDYRHHRDINCFRQAIIWLRGGFRWFVHAIRDRHIRTSLDEGRFLLYFLVPLQVHLDSQLIHSDFRDVSDFIKAVVKSFALNAPTDCTLILKDHPLDRSYREYSHLVEQLRNEYKLEQRLRYVNVINLTSALRHARGTVVINSTVGLASIGHHTPTKCLGNAVYDIEGLTHQGPLDSFWSEPGSVNAKLLAKFCYWLRTNTQVNGSIWKTILRW